MKHHDIPKASIKAVKQTIVGFYRASPSAEAVDHDDAAENCGKSADVIRRQKAFLTQVGVLHKESQGNHTLTDVGRRLGKALAHDRDEEARDIFRSILLKWEATDRLIEDLPDGYLTKEEVRGSVAYVTGNELSTRRLEAGANGLIDMYEWTGVLETNADGEYTVVNNASDDTEVGGVPEVEVERAADEAASDKWDADEEAPNGSTEDSLDPSERKVSYDLPKSPIDISLELTGEEDPENVHRLILAIRRGLKQELGKVDEDVASEGRATDESLDAIGDD